MNIPQTRRALAKARGGYLGVIEEVLKPPARGEILVEVECSAISPGTELNGVSADPGPAPADAQWRSFGYQNAGRVVAVGEGVSEFSPGQRVACMGAGYAAHATWACVPVNLAVPLPDEVSYEEGAFIALVATALNAVRRAELLLAENVFIAGLGLVGQFTGQLAQLDGAHVMGCDRFANRREAALQGGVEAAVEPDEGLVEAARAFTRGYGMDAAFICFGGDGTKAFESITKLMKRSPDGHLYGRVVIPGGATVTHGFGASLGNLDIRSAARTGPGYHDHEYEHGADYPRVFVPWTTKRHLEEIVRWIAAGQVKVKHLISHRVPLDEAVEACRTLIVKPDTALGVVVMMK